MCPVCSVTYVPGLYPRPPTRMSSNVLGSQTPARQRGCAANPDAWATVTYVLAAKAGASPPQREPFVTRRCPLRVHASHAL
jgi:hypothetical protein